MNKMSYNPLQNIGIKTRQNSNDGFWLATLLPLSLTISTLKNPVITSEIYRFNTIFSIGLLLTNLIFWVNLRQQKNCYSYSTWHLISTISTISLFLINGHGVLTSILGGSISVLFYHQFYIWILKNLPNSFTLGEAAIVSQSCFLIFYTTLLNFTELNLSISRSDIQMETIIIQFGLLGIIMIALSAYNLNIVNPLAFYLLSIFGIIIIVIFLPSLILKQNPVVWIVNRIIRNYTTIKLLLFWIICSCLATIAVKNQIENGKKASTSVRKIFHILAVSVYIPGLLYDCSFLYLATGVVLGIFIYLEIIRILRIPPLGEALQNGLIAFCDDKDSGLIALTPIYLLTGCSLPLWLHPSPCDVTNSTTFTLLPLLSGLLTIGVGDTAASVIGSKLGRFYWPDSKKTIEGTFACILSQLSVVFFLNYFGLLKFWNIFELIRVIGAVIITSLVEAKTTQIDNLVLPLLMYILLI